MLLLIFVLATDWPEDWQAADKTIAAFLVLRPVVSMASVTEGPTWSFRPLLRLDFGGDSRSLSFSLDPLSNRTFSSIKKKITVYWQ